MWYIVEYKKTPKSRTWIFNSATGCETLANEVLKLTQEAGFVARITTQESLSSK